MLYWRVWSPIHPPPPVWTLRRVFGPVKPFHMIEFFNWLGGCFPVYAQAFLPKRYRLLSFGHPLFATYLWSETISYRRFRQYERASFSETDFNHMRANKSRVAYNLKSVLSNKCTPTLRTPGARVARQKPRILNGWVVIQKSSSSCPHYNTCLAHCRP